MADTADTNPFTEDVVAQIKRHMNEDHAGDCRMICQALGGQPQAESALMSGMDADGIDFVAVVDGRDVAVRVPWSERLTERLQVRREVVRMSDQAREVLGLAPRDGR
jgi:putative heme iron utilization protein